MERLREDAPDQAPVATEAKTEDAAAAWSGAGKALNDALIRYTRACSSLKAALLKVGQGIDKAVEEYDAARELKRVRYNECREALEIVLAHIGVRAP